MQKCDELTLDEALDEIIKYVRDSPDERARAVLLQLRGTCYRRAHQTGLRFGFWGGVLSTLLSVGVVWLLRQYGS